MELVLHGYLDASGNDHSPTDTLITVNGVLSTPERWDEFDREWQDFLKNAGFGPEPRFNERYVYHTSPFWAGTCERMPKGLTKADKVRIHRGLIEIINRYALYKFGFASQLDEQREIEREFPYAKDLVFGLPGSFLSKICFRHNQQWAEENGYEPAIKYIFDRGDPFWKDLNNSFREAKVELPDESQRTVAALECRNKAEFSPIQAADILAWECRKHLGEMRRHKVGALASHLRPRRFEMHLLNNSDTSFFSLFHGGTFRDNIYEACREWLEREGIDESELAGQGKDELCRALLAKLIDLKQEKKSEDEERRR